MKKISMLCVQKFLAINVNKLNADPAQKKVYENYFKKPSIQGLKNRAGNCWPHDPARYSPAALEQVRSRRMVRYEQMHWLNDFKLLLLSWTYDLNFRHTRLEFLNREYVHRIAKTLPGTKEIKALEQQLGQDLSETGNRNDGKAFSEVPPLTSSAACDTFTPD